MAIDLSNPLNIRAEMARRELVPHQLRPWDSPDGYHDPMDDPAIRSDIVRFLGEVYQACITAEGNRVQTTTVRRQKVKVPSDTHSQQGRATPEHP